MLRPASDTISVSMPSSEMALSAWAVMNSLLPPFLGLPLMPSTFICTSSIVVRARTVIRLPG